MATALVTGFEPFARWTVNSSGEAALALGAARPDLATRVLPVDHEAASAALAAALEEIRPEVLLMTGLADGPRPRLELRARRPAHLGGGDERARAGLWPWAAARDALRATGTPAAFSTDAGRYVCETVYWAGLGALGRGPRRVAFLHVPPLSETWPTARVAAAVAACLEAGGG